jgi:hypothetical protein
MYRFSRVAWGLALVAVVVTLAAAPAAATAGSGSRVDALLAATDHGRPSRDAVAQYFQKHPKPEVDVQAAGPGLPQRVVHRRAESVAPASTDPPQGLLETYWELWNLQYSQPGWYCVDNVYIYSVGAGMNVAAERDFSGGYKGMLRARTPNYAIGPWEYFFACLKSDASWTFRANANNLWVATELTYSGDDRGMLRARTPGNVATGPWEQFYLIGPGPTPMCDITIVSHAANGLVSAEMAYSGNRKGMLRARPGQGYEGPWEEYC